MKKIGNAKSDSNEKVRQILRNVTDLLIVLLLPGPLLVVLVDSTLKQRPYFESVRSFHETYLTDLFIVVGLVIAVFVAFDVYRKFVSKS